MSETAAKGGNAALQSVAAMMNESVFFTEHKNRVLVNAKKKARQGEGIYIRKYTRVPPRCR